MGTIVLKMGTTKKQGDIASALFGKARRALLSLFYGSPDDPFYIRQAVRRTGLAKGSVQREIKRLADAGLLERFSRGREVYCQANHKCPVFEELRGLMAKTAGLADVVRQALLPLEGRIQTALIYGSQASGKTTAGSDVDLLVVGDVDEMKLHKAINIAERKLSRPVNYSLMTPSEFSRRSRDKSGFVGRVLKGPKIAILGSLNEI